MLIHHGSDHASRWVWVGEALGLPWHRARPGQRGHKWGRGPGLVLVEVPQQRLAATRARAAPTWRQGTWSRKVPAFTDGFCGPAVKQQLCPCYRNHKRRAWPHVQVMPRLSERCSAGGVAVARGTCPEATRGARALLPHQNIPLSFRQKYLHRGT